MDKQLGHLDRYSKVPIVGKYIADSVKFSYAYAVEQADMSQAADAQALADLGAANRAGAIWHADQVKIKATCKA
jgi:hypothetical protein